MMDAFSALFEARNTALGCFRTCQFAVFNTAPGFGASSWLPGEVMVRHLMAVCYLRNLVRFLGLLGRGIRPSDNTRWPINPAGRRAGGLTSFRHLPRLRAILRRGLGPVNGY
jgi:hypothetical protein